MRRLIEDKIAGHEILMPRIAETPAMGNLRDALTASLALVGQTRRIPAKVAPAAKRKRAS